MLTGPASPSPLPRHLQGLHPVSSILPLGRQQFFDQNGNPLASGSVGFYIPTTLTAKSTWVDLENSALNPNPVPLDAGGWATIYGLGQYRQIVLDERGELIWDLEIEAPLTASSLTFSGTSLTSATIGAGTFAFVTQDSLPFSPSQFVIVADAADVANYMVGQIESYSGDLLTFTVGSGDTGGSGTFASWVIALSGPVGPASPVGTPREPMLTTAFATPGDVTYTTPSDTLTSDTFEFTGTGGGGGAFVAGGHRNGGGAGGTFIYVVTGLTPNLAILGHVGAGGGANGSGANTTLIVGTTTVTGAAGLSTVEGLVNGGGATNGTINIPGGTGLTAGPTTAPSGNNTAIGGASFWGSGLSDGSNKPPGAGGGQWPGGGSSQEGDGGNGIIVVRQFRGSFPLGGFGTVVSVAGAGTTDLGALANNLISITGSGTNITSLGNSATTAAPYYITTFTGAQTLVNSSGLKNITSANIVTAAGDTAAWLFQGSSVWQMIGYQTASGVPLAGGGGGGSSGTAGGLINKLINPSCSIAQLGTSLQTVAVAGALVLDGWVVKPAGASCQAVQGTNNRTGALALNTVRAIGASSVTGMQILQRVESYSAAPLNGQLITVQAQIFNGTSSPITPTLTVSCANAQDIWSASTPETHCTAVALQQVAAMSWGQVAYTFQSVGTVGNGIEVLFDFGNNFSSSSDVVMLSEADCRATPGVATGQNSSPPVPELRPIEVELAICQRYLTQTYGNGVGPGTSTRAGMVGGATFQTASGSYAFNVQYPVQMRIAPAIQYWDGAGNPSKVTSGQGSFTDNISISGTFPTYNSATGMLTMLGGFGAASGFFHYLADAGLYP